MSLTPSTMMEIGTFAPDFELIDARTGRLVSRSEFEEGNGLLVLFICAHCPFVKHIESELARIGTDYQNTGLGIVAICANDAKNYPDDSVDKLKEQAERVGFTFPYLVDHSQGVAKAYRAACTPDIFLFDAEMKLIYRGQLDNSRPGNGQPVTGSDLRAAIDALLADEPIQSDQYPAVGCNIKWAPGNEPDYFG